MTDVISQAEQIVRDAEKRENRVLWVSPLIGLAIAAGLILLILAVAS